MILLVQGQIFISNEFSKLHISIPGCQYWKYYFKDFPIAYCIHVKYLGCRDQYKSTHHTDAAFLLLILEIISINLPLF